MRDELIYLTPKTIECGILNLNTSQEIGSHWVSWFLLGAKAYYYDSFGDLRPCKELVDYLRGKDIFYNCQQDQDYSSVYCGHYSILFIFKSFLKYCF